MLYQFQICSELKSWGGGVLNFSLQLGIPPNYLHEHSSCLFQNSHGEELVFSLPLGIPPNTLHTKTLQLCLFQTCKLTSCVW